MIDPTTQAIKELERIHREMPDKRLGEILQQAVDKEGMTNNKNINDLSNKQLHNALLTFRKEHTTLRRNGEARTARRNRLQGLTKKKGRRITNKGMTP